VNQQECQSNIDRNPARSRDQLSVIRHSLLTTVIDKERVEPRADNLLGGMFSNRFARNFFCPENRDRGQYVVPTFSQRPSHRFPS
jgi:hypothetical protein